ncbi:MarC family protein [Frigidibacter sp. RF13]|uniref:MarC family protein n=1 Tax=Frigidibacter sp. RF13 TaxID=2997340 RepID=UPI00226E9865|nr:MarC family protein [Frigidibacter sp. RF13]MCY1125505.1 MarC family protein [Frigidibacter sp. RF13]
MEPQFYLTTFVTLFVIVDPIALVPLFIALTRGMDRAHRRTLALRACLIAAFLLAVFGLVGNKLLQVTGISMPAFRISGGLLLFITALDMLFERRTQRREGQQADPNHDPSVFPLATPLIAGPGAFTTMILLINNTPATGVPHTLAILTIMALVIVVTFLLFEMASLIEKLLGRTGIIVVTRLLGMLLAALSVQFVLDGIKGTGLL